MRPPVEFRDASEYKRGMNDLLRVDPARTVALTVDMQWEYLDRDEGLAPVAAADAQRVIGQTAKLLDFCRGEGIPVIHVYVSRRPIEFEHGFGWPAYLQAGERAGLSQNPNAPVRAHVDRLEGSHGSRVPDELVAPEDLHVVSKRQMDGFHETDLDTLLGRVFRPETVVLTGINTDTCVYATTFGASHRGYKPVVISDCVASMRGEDHHWMALELMARSIAWVLSLEEFVAKVGEPR
jgi:biuret amidohydrolase